MRQVLERQPLWMGWMALAFMAVFLAGSPIALAWWAIMLVVAWTEGAASAAYALQAIALLLLVVGYFGLVSTVGPEVRLGLKNFLKHGGDTIWIENQALHVRPIPPIPLNTISAVTSVKSGWRHILRVTLRGGETLDVFFMRTPDATIAAIRAHLIWT